MSSAVEEESEKPSSGAPSDPELPWASESPSSKKSSKSKSSKGTTPSSSGADFDIPTTAQRDSPRILSDRSPRSSSDSHTSTTLPRSPERKRRHSKHSKKNSAAHAEKKSHKSSRLRTSESSAVGSVESDCSAVASPSTDYASPADAVAAEPLLTSTSLPLCVNTELDADQAAFDVAPEAVVPEGGVVLEALSGTAAETGEPDVAVPSAEADGNAADKGEDDGGGVVIEDDDDNWDDDDVIRPENFTSPNPMVAAVPLRVDISDQTLLSAASGLGSPRSIDSRSMNGPMHVLKYADFIEQLEDPMTARQLPTAVHLTLIDFRGVGLNRLPPLLFELSSVRIALFSRNSLSWLPCDVVRWSESLQVLDVSGNSLTELPPELVRCRNLRSLSVSSNQLTSVDVALQLSSLKHFVYHDNPFQEHVVQFLESFVVRDASLSIKSGNAEVAQLPLARLHWLRWLTISHCNLSSAPREVADLRLLECLDLSGNDLQALFPGADSAGESPSLSSESVSSPRLRLGGSAAPSSLIGGTVTEDMSDDDSQFDSALQLPTSLSSVILDRNCLKSLPIELASLPKLSFLSMERNAVRSITSFPFARLPLLAALRLSHNQITAIPDSVSQLTALEVLELDYNNLLDVPAWLSGMRSLVRLSLSNNRLTETDNLKALLLSEGSGTIQYLNLRGNTGLARESGSSGVHRRSSAGLLAPATGADSSAQYSDSSASQSGQRRPRVYSQDHMLLFRQMVMMNLVRERIASSTLSPVPSGPAGRRKKLTRSLVVNPLFRYLDVDAYRRKHVDLKMISGFELVIKRGRPSLQRSKSAVDDSNLSSEDDRSLSTVKRLKRTFSAKLRSPSDRVASDYDSSGASGSDMSGSESEGGGSGIGGFDRGVISGTVASSARADRIRGGRSTASPEQLSPHPGSVSSRSVPGAIDEAGAAAAAAGGGDAMHSAALGDGAGAVAEAEDLSRMLCDDSFWRRVAKENDDALNVKSVSKYTASFEFMLSSSGSSTTASDQTFSQQFGGKVWEYFSEAKPTFFDDLMDVDGEVLFVRNQSGIGTRIKWATLPRMIELLTHPNGRDLDFESAFLFSFEEFSSAEELLDLLLLRDAALSNVSSIRRRIVFLLKRWVEIHPYHWKANGFRLVEQLRSWMRESTFSTEVAEAVSGLKDLLLERTTLWERSRRNRLLAFNYSRSSTYASTWQFRSCSSEEVSELFQVTVRAMPQPVAWFLSTSVQQLAGQLTLMDSVFYMTLEPRELFNTRWMKRDKAVLAKGTLRLIHQSNRVSQWVSSLVVSLEDVTQRQLVIERFILLAQRFLDMRNFHGIVAILSGLASLPVQRLKKTWARVRPGAAQMYQYLHDLMMDIPHNLRKFRALLELSSPPCVPYLGIFLRDLVHINETSRPTTPRSTRSIPTSLDSMQVLRVRRTSDLAKKKRSKSRKSAEDSPRRSGRAKDDGGSATDVALPPSEQQSVPRLNLALTRTSGEDEDVEPLSSGRDYCNLLGHSAVTVDPHRASTLRQRAWKLINFERLEMESLVVRKVLHFQQYTFSIRPAHKILPLIAPDLGLEEEELYRLSTLREAVAGGPIDFS